MSGPAGSGSGPGHYAGQAQHGPTAGGGGGASGAPSAPATTPSDLNKIVTDYLLKKGFTQTEATFRKESADLGPDGRPVHKSALERGPKKFQLGFNLVKEWIENNLDVYKFELRKVLWPVFVYSFLDLVEGGYVREAQELLSKIRPYFEAVHGDALKTFATISLPIHVRENEMARKYRENRYRIPLNQYVNGNLYHFLEREHDNGGSVVTYILQTYCTIETSDRGPLEPYSFEAIYRGSQNLDLDEVNASEGIPGVFTGVNNRDVLDATAPLKLGPMAMEPDLRDDVRAELEDEDNRHPPAPGRSSLVDEFDRKIKREESADGPTRADLPLPPSRARDVIIEMQKVRENRDRFKIEGRTGGVGGIPLSICMFTFHNTLGSVTSMDFSKDNKLVAVGTMDSYIRVWTLDGKPLTSKVPQEKDLYVNNRRLIGHSGPVYGVSFSDSIANLERNIYGDEENKVETAPKLLLSCSADGQVRLWSLDVWSCLCVYKAHHGPVFRVLWGPHGHYFATAGWDRTVRIFMQDHATAQRILVGHDTSISAIAWHPNGTYVFSASDEQDKSIRMWSVNTGACVRVFTGHADYITTLAVAPNGKILASADSGGNIMFWDINKGKRIKRSRGHGKGGIPSICFSVESNVLVSGGLDGTVRLWDVELPADGSKAAASAAAAAAAAASAAAAPASSAAGTAGAHAQQDSAGAGGTGDTVTVGGTGERSIVVGAQPAQPPATAAAATAAPQGGTGAAAGGGGGGGGGGVGGGSGGTAKKKGKEVMITPDQISAFPTKKTPVLKVQFTRMNLVVAGGCFDPER